MNNKEILEALVSSNENVIHSFPENIIRHPFSFDYNYEKEFEDNFENGHINWNEKYGRSLKVGDKVLFVFENGALSHGGKESFINDQSGILTITEINTRTGRFSLEGKYGIYPEYNGKFFIKSGVSTLYPKGKGQLKILVEEKYRDLESSPDKLKKWGKITTYVKDKGFGFIKTLGSDCFFHVKNFEDKKDIDVVKVGTRVRFNSAATSKGMAAFDIVVINN